MNSITLYTAKICPFAHRVEIALTEAEVKYKAYQIDLWDKPEWYTPRVNPAGKIPAMTYGGPDVPPDEPSSESVKLAESSVLVEFVADLFPEANLIPQDPTLRARARSFVEVVNAKFAPAYTKFVIRGEGYEDVLAAVEAIQDILPQAATGIYAMGEQYTIADISLAPFIARLKLVTASELGRYPVGQGSEFLQALDGPKYNKFNLYVQRLLDRQSLQTTFDAEHNKDVYAQRVTRA